MKNSKIQVALKTTFRNDIGQKFIRSKHGRVNRRPPGVMLTLLLKKIATSEKLIQLTLTTD